jgi:hypothetical protein
MFTAMRFITITVNYIAKWQLTTAPEYIYTSCQKCYNLKSGKFIKEVLKGSTIGYIIRGKFRSIEQIKKDLEPIPKEYF